MIQTTVRPDEAQNPEFTYQLNIMTDTSIRVYINDNKEVQNGINMESCNTGCSKTQDDMV